MLTIKSRCLKLNLPSHNFNNFENILISNNISYDDEILKLLFDITNGSPGLSLKYNINTIKGQFEELKNSLIDSGVTLGISSRGVGSTKRVGEHQVVQDDFQLICWDFVSEPSTPGAFMMKEGKEIQVEQVLAKHFNKTDRVDRIFNEILDWSEE